MAKLFILDNCNGDMINEADVCFNSVQQKYMSNSGDYTFNANAFWGIEQAAPPTG